MSPKDFADAQRIVLRGDRWAVAQQVMLRFRESSSAPAFLQALMKARQLSRAKDDDQPPVQFSLGFTRRGLKHARVPDPVLACFAAKAPAFTAGAACRATQHLGLCGADAPTEWDCSFAFLKVDAVLSLHANNPALLDAAVVSVTTMANRFGIRTNLLQRAGSLTRPKEPEVVHFGYRDSLSRVGIKGWTNRDGKCLPAASHEAGEFLLGHPQDSGANPWVASGGRVVWSKELRAFFRNGSFGVLAQIRQHARAFEDYVADQHRKTGIAADRIKGLLCGRMPDGCSLAVPEQTKPDFDAFTYAADPRGERCPFGAHVRRMNPRGGEVALTRTRALLRRGMPYGTPWTEKESVEVDRGLFGQFFCASIEDQFEHLMGQWADRVPMGSPDAGGARDPLIGAHAPGDGGFEVPQKNGSSLWFDAMPRFTTTRGLAYLFYPSVSTLGRIARSEFFVDFREDAE